MQRLSTWMRLALVAACAAFALPAQAALYQAEGAGPRAYLVESIPVGMDDLRATRGVEYTGATLRRLTEAAQETIDLTAMYWNLLPGPDSKGFSKEQRDAFGADEGQALYEALQAAAKRGVRIRILQAATNPESDAIVKANKKRVSTRQINMNDWYGGGIMHQKIWIFDHRNVYVGSANMDWKSLTQVKEMGVVVEHQPAVAEDLTRQFDAWWKFAGMPVKGGPTGATEGLEPVSAFDARAGIERLVPNWSRLVPEKERRPSPFAEFATKFDLRNPLPLVLEGKTGGVFISGSPPELCPPGRTYDGDGIVQTILDAEESVAVSVMDFAPTSLYRENEDRVTTPVWWPELVDALLTAVMARGVHARLLVSHWAHTNPVIAPFLEALERTAAACLVQQDSTCGRLEIRLFLVPGWDRTGGQYRKFPGHTRVNHPKYVVTDRRANIGTSNMTWSYFTSTAGASFNTDHPELVEKLQEVFDRDWSSRYAFPLSAVD